MIKYVFLSISLLLCNPLNAVKKITDNSQDTTIRIPKKIFNEIQKPTKEEIAATILSQLALQKKTKLSRKLKREKDRIPIRCPYHPQCNYETTTPRYRLNAACRSHFAYRHKQCARCYTEHKKTVYAFQCRCNNEINKKEWILPNSNTIIPKSNNRPRSKDSHQWNGIGCSFCNYKPYATQLINAFNNLCEHTSRRHFYCLICNTYFKVKDSAKRCIKHHSTQEKKNMLSNLTK